MTSRVLLAPLRCLALACLAVAGFLVLLVAILCAALVFPVLFGAAAIRSTANLSRRLAGAWGGVTIPLPAPHAAPAPHRREDGWYEHENQLYRSPRMPTFLMEAQAIGGDPSRTREWNWLFVNPVVGLPLVLLPPLALLAGGWLLAAAAGQASLPGPAALPAGAMVPLGLVLVATGFAAGPAVLRLHARLSAVLLLNPEQSWLNRSGMAPWIRRHNEAIWHGAGLAGLSFAAIGGLVLNLLAVVVSWGGLLPWASLVSRWQVQLFRRKAREWTGEPMPEPYRPLPEPPVRGADGRYRAGRTLYTERSAAIRAQRYGWVARDPATWRDLLWMATAPVVSLPALIPAFLMAFGFFGLVWQVIWWAPWAVPIGLIYDAWVTPWYMWYGVTHVIPAAGVVPAWASVLVGLAAGLVSLVMGAPLLRLRLRWDRWLLHPTRSAELAQRVRRLTETRADAADAQAAELRRIERDLHDGAQARMVAVGMGLAAVERLLDEDPAAAREILAQSRATAGTAITELRALVRGIHPPVLAERGLAEAIRAVALDSPLPVSVTVADGLAGRPEPAVESAAYFAVTELLANAARHSGASRVEVTVGHDGEVLRVTVRDDGHGGAGQDGGAGHTQQDSGAGHTQQDSGAGQDGGAGTGLAGIRRRLGTFDGVLALHSPPGGPTVATMEIPCALSSPRTSTSSGTD